MTPIQGCPAAVPAPAVPSSVQNPRNHRFVRNDSEPTSFSQQRTRPALNGAERAAKAPRFETGRDKESCGVVVVFFYLSEKNF